MAPEDREHESDGPHEMCRLEIQRLTEENAKLQADNDRLLSKPRPEHIRECYPNIDTMTREELATALENELHDLSLVAHGASKVFCEITGSQASKPLTDPDVIIALAADQMNRWCDDELKQMREQLTTLLRDGERWKRLTKQTSRFYVMVDGVRLIFQSVAKLFGGEQWVVEADGHIDATAFREIRAADPLAALAAVEQLEGKG